MSVFVKQTRADQLCEKIRELIEQGQWEGGQKMPPIRALANRFEVSVTTALNAMRQLEKLGMIERRPRGSSFIRQGDFLPAPSSPQGREPRKHIAIISAPTPKLATGEDNWTSHIQAGIESQIMVDSRYYMTHLGSAVTDLASYIAAIRLQIDDLTSQLAGVIFFGSDQVGLYDALTAHLDQRDLPWMSIYSPHEKATHNHVSADNHGVGLIAGRALAMMGLEHVALLSPPFNWAFSFRQTMLGVYDAFMHAGLPTTRIHHVVTPACDVEDGYKAMGDFLRTSEPPQAIVATGDPIAIGAMRACAEQGIDIPGSLAVISTTGLEIAEHCSPSLTVIPQPMEKIGRLAVRRLLEMIDRQTQRTHGVRIPSRMIIRESFRPSEQVRAELSARGMIQKSRRRRRRKSLPLTSITP